METLRTIKSFLARLAGVPLAALRPERDRAIALRTPPRAPSGLYEARLPLPAALAPRRRSATSKQLDGDEGEAFARRWLEAAGLVFVAANVSYRDGELDLVMRDDGGSGGRDARSGSALVFVEVRRRARGSHGGAAGSITREKRRRVVAAAAHYLVGLGLRSLPTCRFDVVTLEGDRLQGFKVAWIRDAFRDEG